MRILFTHPISSEGGYPHPISLYSQMAISPLSGTNWTERYSPFFSISNTLLRAGRPLWGRFFQRAVIVDLLA